MPPDYDYDYEYFTHIKTLKPTKQIRMHDTGLFYSWPATVSLTEEIGWISNGCLIKANLRGHFNFLNQVSLVGVNRPERDRLGKFVKLHCLKGHAYIITDLIDWAYPLLNPIKQHLDFCSPQAGVSYNTQTSLDPLLELLTAWDEEPLFDNETREYYESTYTTKLAN
jgi:hypothetical protein